MVAPASLLYRRITNIPDDGILCVYLLAGLDKTDTTSIPLVHHVNFTTLLVAEHIEIMVNVIQSKHRLLHRNLLGQIVATPDNTFQGEGERISDRWRVLQQT